MNIKLIKKYKKEFDHLVEGGNVLMGKRDYNNGAVKWYPSISNPFIESSESIVVVINDEYVKYRKALAEGKELETIANHSATAVSYPSDTDSIIGLTWKPYNRDFKGLIASPRCYRIKPDENKFKVDDWVIELCPDVDDYCKPKPSGEPFQIKEVIKGNTGWLYKKEKDNYNRELFEAYLIKWKPQANEWCWFWDASHEIKYSNLSQFVDMYGTKFRTKGATYENCAPFTEKLPQHLKDLK